MHKQLRALESCRLLVLTGKGGSGKSILAAALALLYAKQGKKVWLVEIGRKRDKNFSRLPEILSVDALQHTPTKISCGGASFEASILDPTQSLAEYLDMKLPTGGLAGILLNNRVTASFLEIVPGLPEMVSLGKIWHALVEKKDGPDIVILDGPASGHCVSLLHSPENFEKLTSQGPLHRDAFKMKEFLESRKEVAVLLTSLPEEMSLEESVEHHQILHKLSLPLLFVNKIFPKLGKLKEKSKDKVLQAAYDYSSERASREETAIEEFANENKKWPILEIPFFFPDETAPPLVERVAAHLEQS